MSTHQETERASRGATRKVARLCCDPRGASVAVPRQRLRHLRANARRARAFRCGASFEQAARRTAVPQASPKQSAEDRSYPINSLLAATEKYDAQPGPQHRP